MIHTQPKKPRQRYDGMTLALHWITAASVIFLFASAHIWEWLERGTPLRKGLQSVHISCGIVLALVMVIRPVWRLMSQRSPRYAMPAAAVSRPAKLLSHCVHGALYLLLFTQIVLGFMFRWAQQEPFGFFGLFDLSGWVHVDPLLKHALGELHNNVAWALIILAAFHAMAALFHHYFLRDNVLRRMLPVRLFR
ncbi:cytochrome b [Pantoea ananatis]|uniref:cytochrome b n=1 Tax=Pantoea ananas TaxID=553 RepID=UPI000497DABB|nr:cytochrome b [Pantoea ananatis]MDN4126007.1 cytochrome b [Pantoea ananatis]MDN4150381.1 cytochrome b [Pantoea ananatis]PQK84982.1 cytochrome b [Pantoea ananatis]PWK12193.1 cytochrome b561 [Pantoea ananatis]